MKLIHKDLRHEDELMLEVQVHLSFIMIQLMVMIVMIIMAVALEEKTQKLEMVSPQIVTRSSQIGNPSKLGNLPKI